MTTNYKYELQELQKGLAELELREMHPLRVYRPTEQQLPVHESQASEVIVVGGKRSGKAQPVDEPVLTPDGWCAIGDLRVGDVIIGGDGKPCVVTGVFSQGTKPVFRVTFGDGAWTRCCGEHLWRIQTGQERYNDRTGNWQTYSTKKIIDAWGPEPSERTRPTVPVCEVWMPTRDTPVDPYLLGILLGDGCLSGRSIFFSTADEEVVESVKRAIPGEVFVRKTKNPKKVTYDYQISAAGGRRNNALLNGLRPLGIMGKRSWEKSVPDSYLFNQRSVRLDLLRGLMDSDGTMSGCGASFTTTSPELASAVCALVRSLGGRASLGSWRIKYFTYKGQKKAGRPCITVAVNMRQYCPFRLGRKARLWDKTHSESRDNLPRVMRSIKPDGEAECVCISVSCPDRTYITRDYIITHNTLATVMEFGSRLLGIPITRPDGTPIKGRRFKKPSLKSPKLYWVIGLDVQHIGQTLYHRLFSLGLGCDFRIFKDKKTGQWTAYNPNLHADIEDETVLSPPMFGEGIIDPKSWHMESAAGNIFKSVRFYNGVTLCAYATTGDYPKQGDAVDGIWLDEDTANAEFLKEWHDRLSTRRGWWLWSVWPKVANEALIKTLERAKTEEDNPNPPIKLIRLVGSENPYSDKAGIAEALARMDDDDDAAHRDRGDIDAFISGRQMYDFGTAIHIVQPMPEIVRPESPFTLICKLLSQDGKLPASWTRYLFIDPSHTRTACLFGVVPPGEWEGIEMGDRLIIEKELVVTKHTPAMFASALLPYTNALKFEAFVMDQMVGRQTTVGSDTTVFNAYEREFRQRGIMSRITGSGFMRGSNDKSTRRRAVRTMLEPIHGGWPSLWIARKCPQTIKEFFSYRKKEIKDSAGRSIPLDDVVNERIFDCMASLEYGVEYISNRFRDGTAYVEPEKARSVGSIAYQIAVGLKESLDKAASYVNLGPGST